MDHIYLRECIETIKDAKSDKNEILSYAKSFLDTLKRHSEAETKCVYQPLLQKNSLRTIIMKNEIEHGIADDKVRFLIPKVKMAKIVKDELLAELIVLAELVEHHIASEENILFSQMKNELDQDVLNDMGFEFMKLRQFSEKDLSSYPDLLSELYQWKNSPPRVSNQFLHRMSVYTESTKH